MEPQKGLIWPFFFLLVLISCIFVFIFLLSSREDKLLLGWLGFMLKTESANNIS